MKISRKQAESIFNLIRDEVNNTDTKHRKEVRAYNKKLEADTLERFKKTPEFKALMLIKKSFRNFDNSVNFGTEKLTRIAMSFLKVKHKSEYLFAHNQAPVVEVLAIDCKNLKELLEVVKKHYGIKKNVDLNLVGKYKTRF